jgi:hypothetical protein
LWASISFINSLLDREFLRLHRAGLADRHGARDGMQDADRDLGIGHRQSGRVDLRRRKLLSERARREHRGRRYGRGTGQKFATVQG